MAVDASHLPPTISAVASGGDDEITGGDDGITVPEAARLHGMAVHSAYALIERGELHAEVVQLSARPRQRRSFRLTRRDVDDFLERPG